MCSPAAIGPAASAIGGAMEASAQNKAARRQYEHQLKVRERKWMMDTSLFKTKRVQFDKNISEANLAAQRAYSQSATSLNNIRSKALLDHQADFQSMLEAEGMIEAQAAERGVRGASVLRSLNTNLAKMGMANAQRSRALTQSLYAYEQGNEAIRRKLISDKNNMWSKVSIQLVPDMAPPKPVMRNVGLTLFTGMAGALGAGLDGMGDSSSISSGGDGN